VLIHVDISKLTNGRFFLYFCNQNQKIWKTTHYPKTAKICFTIRHALRDLLRELPQTSYAGKREKYDALRHELSWA